MFDASDAKTLDSRAVGISGICGVIFTSVLLKSIGSLSVSFESTEVLLEASFSGVNSIVEVSNPIGVYGYVEGLALVMRPGAAEELGLDPPNDSKQ